MLPGLFHERGGERITCFIALLVLLWKCRAAEAAKLQALRWQNQSSSLNAPSPSQLELGSLGCAKTERYWRLPDNQHCYNNHDTASKAEACNWAYAPATSSTIHQCWWDAKRSLCQSRERPLCKRVHEKTGNATRSPAPEISYRKSWDDGPDMLWLGKDWFANGVQDWEIANGRLECSSSVPMVAGRTAHLLTQAVPEANRPFSVEFDIDTVEPGKLADRAQGGILLGLGDERSDYRQSALVQMVPGPGGGMLVALGADGALSVRKFTELWGPSTLWHACEPKGNGYDFSYLPKLVNCTGRAELVHGSGAHMRVSYVPGEKAAGSFLVTAKGNGSSSVAKCAGTLARSHVAGGVSLFSAYGPEGSEKGFAFDNLELTGTASRPERAFGPVLGVLYTQATFGGRRSGLEGRDVRELRMTVQLPVLGRGHRLDLQLAIDRAPAIPGTFHSADGSWTSRFVVRESAAARWPREERRYRLLLNGSEVYSGILRKEKRPNETTTVGSLSCNKNAYGNVQWNRNGMWFPFNNVSNAVAVQDPDLLFFSGDQVYNGDITPADWRSEDHSLLDFHYKWQRFLWSFGSLTKDRPTVTIPDDHDLWQGNIWGEGGHSNVKLEVQLQSRTLDDVAGFMLSNHFINAVQATMVSHLPPTRVAPRIGNEGINTYTTSFRYGGLDIMVLADRLWKTGPFSNASVKHLLGPEQEALLGRWAQKRFPDAWTKVVLSQTPMGSMFTGYKEIPHFGEYLGHQNSSVSKDSNGYPPEARRRAVQLLASAGALHLTGDQHLGLVAQYGSEQFEDGTMVFSAPAVASAYARYWMPGHSNGFWPGAKRYMGHYEDGFGNKFTMLAVSNPVKHDPGRMGTPLDLTEKSPGYGIIRFHPTMDGKLKTGIVALENWPTWANPCELSQMYLDWPIVLDAHARPISRKRQLPARLYDAHKGPCLLRLRDPNVTEEFYRKFYFDGA